VDAIKVTILQKDIPINQIQKIEVIIKRSGMLIFCAMMPLVDTKIDV